MTNQPNRRRVLAGLAASTIAAGSTAGASPKPTGATPETLDALQTYYARRDFYDNLSAQTEEEDMRHFLASHEAEKALLTSPTRTVEDIALKLEYALAMELCGGVYASDLKGLDNNMFRDMIAALRGPITDAIKAGG